MQKIEAKISAINFEDVYSTIPRKYWHNAILSIDDGLASYSFNFNDFPESTKMKNSQFGGNLNHRSPFWHSPYIWEPASNRTEIYETKTAYTTANNNKHIPLFLMLIGQYLKKVRMPNFDIINYLDLGATDTFTARHPNQLQGIAGRSPQ